MLTRIIFSVLATGYDNKIISSISESQKTSVVLGSSVRSLFSTYLKILSKSGFDTVIFTAISLKDMHTIANNHVKHVTSVDIDPGSQQPNLVELKAKLKKHPKSIVVLTPLFGAIVNYDEPIKLCRKYKAKIVIDNAQGFRGIENIDYTGYDILLWSFGPIKTMTSLGGGVALVNSTSDLLKMNNIIKNYPATSNISFRLRAIKYVFLRLLSKPSGFTFFIYLTQILNLDHNKIIHSTTRLYSSDIELIQQITKKPVQLQIKLLYLQLKFYDTDRILSRSYYGQHFEQSLNKLKIFGSQTENHSFWLTPVVDTDNHLKNLLVAKGYHASNNTSSLSLLPNNTQKHLQSLFDNIIYVPIDPEMQIEDIYKLTIIADKYES